MASFATSWKRVRVALMSDGMMSQRSLSHLLSLLGSALLLWGCPLGGGEPDALTYGDVLIRDGGLPDLHGTDLDRHDTGRTDHGPGEHPVPDHASPEHDPGDAAVADSGEDAEPFRVVAIPDTQYQVAEILGGLNEMFYDMTQWIADNAEALNIVFVIHEGDITWEYQLEEQWVVARAAMSTLDGVVPYVIAVGNHDGLNDANCSTQNYNAYFPLEQFSDLPSFGGVFEAGKMDNTFHYFSAGGFDWLVLAIEFGPRDVVVEWADQIVAAHPNRKVILGTHAYLHHDSTLLGSSPSHGGVPTTYGRENNGTDIWEKLVKRHANMTSVVCGHIVGRGRLLSTGDNGNKVLQMLADYSTHTGDFGGGYGYMRILTFDPQEDTVSVQSYSPFLDEYLTGDVDEFEYEEMGIFD